MARDPKSAWALRNRAFIRALVGFDVFAIDDLEEADKLDKDAKTPAPRQDWLALLDAYLHYDVARLEAEKGKHAALAAYLKMTCLEHPSGTRIGVQAARDLIQTNPDCDRAYYFVCARGQEKRAPIKAFRDWVFAEMEETQASLSAALAARAGAHPADSLSPSPSAIHRRTRATKTRGRTGRGSG